jgi:hypothetical protein
VERRGLEPRYLLCKSSVRPLNYHPRTGPPRGEGPRFTRHDVKESDPLGGSVGSSPATVAYVVSGLPRGPVILYLLDARVNLSVQSIFDLFLWSVEGG